MNKLLAILKGVGKAAKFILLLKVLIDTFEYFNKRCKEEFPDAVDVEPQKDEGDGSKLLK
jgi:hypothetical protein